MRTLQSLGDNLMVCGALFGWRLDALLIGATVSLLAGGYHRLAPLPVRRMR